MFRTECLCILKHPDAPPLWFGLANPEVLLSSHLIRRVVSMSKVNCALEISSIAITLFFGKQLIAKAVLTGPNGFKGSKNFLC